jgi:hypothetical protein
MKKRLILYSTIADLLQRQLPDSKNWDLDLDLVMMTKYKTSEAIFLELKKHFRDKDGRLPETIFIDEAANLAFRDPEQLPPVVESESPPALAEFLLTFLARDEHRQAALGDLNETFVHNCAVYGHGRAARLYWAEALKSLWPLAWRMLCRAVRFGVLVDAVKRFLS